jgi:PAS domain S-box-containing protein
MVNWIRLFLARPHYDDDEEDRIAGFLHLVTLSVMAITLLVVVVDALERIWSTGLILGAASLPFLLALWLNKHGKITLASYLVVFTMIFAVTWLLSVGQGIHDIGIIDYALVLIVASFLLKEKGVILTTCGMIVSVAVVVWGEIDGFLPLKIQPTDFQTGPGDFVIVSLIVFFGAIASNLMIGTLNRTIKKAREAETRWRSLVENAPDVILLVAMDGQIKFVNNSSQEETRRQIIGHKLYEYLPETERKTVERIIEKVKAGQVVVKELPAQSFNGENRWFSFRISPIPQEDGRIEEAVVIATDIQHKKDAEDELQLSRKTLQVRAEQLTTLYEIGKTVANLQNLDGVFKVILKEMMEIIPLDFFMIILYAEETNEISFPLLYDRGKLWQEPSRVLPEISWTTRVIRTKTPIVVHRTPEELENEIKWLPIGDTSTPSASIMMTPMLLGERVLGVISAQSYAPNAYNQEHLSLISGAANQIAIAIENARLYEALQKELAERKHAEAEVRQLNAVLEARVRQRTQEVEAANTELAAFTYSVSHDLRAPLRGIDGLSHIFLEEFGEDFSEPARAYLQRIQGNARQMGKLIDSLLLFTRLGRQVIRKTEFKMDELVSQVFHELTLALNGTRQIRLDLHPMPTAYADRALMREVIINLISNAVKFTARTESARVEIGGESTSAELTYYIRDNGEGFNMAYASKLFGIFQRLHRQDEFEGTGVGLSIAQRIIQRHGGRIWAEGSPRAGAVFYFTLPAKDA